MARGEGCRLRERGRADDTVHVTDTLRTLAESLNYTNDIEIWQGREHGKASDRHVAGRRRAR